MYDANSPEHKVIEQRMLQARQRRSEIERLVSSNQLSMRKTWIKLFVSNGDLNFPHLCFDFLRQYTCTTYQIKQTKAYAKAHLYENDGGFMLELSASDDNLLRCCLQSRHFNNTKYFLCVQFDENDDEAPIKDHYY